MFKSNDKVDHFFFLHVFQLFLDDTKVKNFITCFKGTCTSQFVSIKLVHVADVTYLWLTTSAKQYQDPCFGSLMESVNYQQCFLNFPFNLITVANPGEGPTPSYFWTKKIVLGDCHVPPPYLRVSMSGSGHWISQLNHGFFIKPTVVQTQILLHS